MKRSDLEHGVRAACDLTGAAELVIIGSQAILGQYPHAPRDVTRSLELDVFLRNNPAASDLIDGVLGDRSHFHDTHGFFLHGIGPETATLPEGWRERLVPVRNENTGGCTGWCLEAHDIAASKLVAGREKDRDYVAALLRHRMVAPATLAERIAALPLPDDRTQQLARLAERLAREAG